MEVEWCRLLSIFSLLPPPIKFILPLFPLIFFLRKFVFNSFLPIRIFLLLTFLFSILFCLHGVEANCEVLVHVLNFVLEASSHRLSCRKCSLCDFELFIDCTRLVSYTCLSDFMIFEYAKRYAFMFVLI